MGKGMSVRGYAAYRKERGLPGGSRYGVQKALKDGRITKEQDGSIDPARADRDWEGNTSPAKQRDPIPSSYQEARAIREALNARITRLEYEERLGKLVSVEEVKREAFLLGRRLRDRLLAIPDRIAATVAAETDPRKIAAILTDEIVRALEEVMEA